MSRVTFTGGDGSSVVIDPTSGGRFPLGQPVDNVSDEVVERLRTTGLEFDVQQDDAAPVAGKPSTEAPDEDATGGQS